MMPVSSRGPQRRSCWCHTPLIDPQYPHACEAGGVIRCGLQARLDMGGIPRGAELSGQATGGGSLEAQLTNRPADRPDTQTCPGDAHRVVLLNESHDLAGVFAAYPTPYCATVSAPGPRPRPASITSTTIRPWPCAITPQPGQPARQSQDSMSRTRPQPRRATAISRKPSKPTSRSHRSQRSSDAEQQQVAVRHRPRSLEDSGGRSPLIIKDLTPYPQPPTNTRSPTLNSEDPLIAL